MRTGQTVGYIAGSELLQVIDCILVAANQLRRNAPSIVIREDAGRSGGSQFSTNFDERWLPGRKKRLLIFGEPLPRAVALLSYGTSAAGMIESRGCAANTLAPRNNQFLTKCNDNGYSARLCGKTERRFLTRTS